ncbi:MAG TPA: GerAB/ArcD/ProY family transporter, partial [Halanaerobiales bacterium]|nr:GerAB/ArcD/ProY family transporter [Halanaerobiales bacterium]
FWVVTIFTTAANVYYASVVGFTQIFKLKEHKTLTLTLLPLAYLSAILPDNLHDVFEYVDIVTKFAAGLIITTIIIYFAAIFIKGRKGDERS